MKGSVMLCVDAWMPLLKESSLFATAAEAMAAEQGKGETIVTVRDCGYSKSISAMVAVMSVGTVWSTGDQESDSELPTKGSLGQSDRGV
jgi:hypothetical protein